MSTNLLERGARTASTGTDDVTGVYRYYDPSTSQFLSVDPLVDETGTPYAYAGGDPINASDPSGLDCGGIGGFLASLSPLSHCNKDYQKAYNNPIQACANALLFGTSGGGVCSNIPGTQQYQKSWSHGTCPASFPVTGAGLDPSAPLPPGYDPNTWSIGSPSRKSNPFDSYYDPEGGQWRWHPPDPYHNGHWDYKAAEPANAPWERIPGPDGAPPLIEPFPEGGFPIDG